MAARCEHGHLPAAVSGGDAEPDRNGPADLDRAVDRHGQANRDADRRGGPGPAARHRIPGALCPTTDPTSADPPDPVGQRAGQPPVSWDLNEVGARHRAPPTGRAAFARRLLDAIADPGLGVRVTADVRL